ncbi:nucleotidyltransferase domain-containing protein [Synechococcus sp. UW140]|uniref:nucleotidyltransferase domain-containing protein n=1 Tax=Synechococcus sp. UW140 TaxID=368503 RepID=UPI003137BD8F
MKLHGAAHRFANNTESPINNEPFDCYNPKTDPLVKSVGRVVIELIPTPLRLELSPILEVLVNELEPQGLWLFGSWARGNASLRSDVDILVMGFENQNLLDAYNSVLEVIYPCPLPLQPLIAGKHLLTQHGDAPFWRSIKNDAIPLLLGSKFP